MHIPEQISPWLAQLHLERPSFQLSQSAETDVAIVGAGIAGISTAYNVLKRTDARVLLIEAGRIAHGATGRNAGQLVSEFERPLTDMVEQYGLQMTAQAQAAVESAWGLLDDMQQTCELRTPVTHCKGYSGLSTEEQIIEHLRELSIRIKTGLATEPLILSAASNMMNKIPQEFQNHVIEMPHSMILSLLNTEDPQYIALVSSKIGCANSALLCEEIASWMISHYGNRFAIAEHSPVTKINLGKKSATLTLEDGKCISAARVVLCTNGFENFDINNTAGPDITSSFHAFVHGVIGYMAAYFEPSDGDTSGMSYFDASRTQEDPYHYITRRSYERAATPPCGLVCIGGPERFLPDCATYDTATPFPSDIEEELNRTIHRLLRKPIEALSCAFLWHGLMGYTSDRIRRIGFDPRNPVLLYNLGCNGIGILPSIYGGKRIAQILGGHTLSPSIFDPR